MEHSTWILALSSMFPYSLLLQSLEIFPFCIMLAGCPMVCDCALSPLLRSSDLALPSLQAPSHSPFRTKFLKVFYAHAPLCHCHSLLFHLLKRGLCSHDSTDIGYHFKWAISLCLTWKLRHAFRGSAFSLCFLGSSPRPLSPQKGPLKTFLMSVFTAPSLKAICNLVSFLLSLHSLIPHWQHTHLELQSCHAVSRSPSWPPDL